MKKFYLGLTSILFSLFVSAQVPTCSLDPVFVASNKYGISPDSATNFLSGTVGVPYLQNITVKVPKDTVTTLITVCFTRFVLSNPTGTNNYNLPPGLNFGSSTTSLANGNVNGAPSFKFPGNANNCASIYGTPTNPGVYNLQLQVEAYGDPLLFGSCSNTPNVSGGTLINTSTLGYYKIVINPATGIEQIGVNTFNLENIPNPFNGKTKIKFFVLDSDEAEFSVHDMLGKQVFSIKTETTPGENELEFDGTGLNNGIFFYTIKFKNFSETKRMIIQSN